MLICHRLTSGRGDRGDAGRGVVGAQRRRHAGNRAGGRTGAVEGDRELADRSTAAGRIEHLQRPFVRCAGTRHGGRELKRHALAVAHRVEVLDRHAERLARAARFGRLRGQVGGKIDLGGRARGEVDARDIDALQALEAVARRIGGHRRAIGIQAPAERIQPAGIAQEAVAIGPKRAGAGEQELVLRVDRAWRRGVDDGQKAPTTDREVGAGGGGLDHALLRDRVPHAGQHAASPVLTVAALRRDQAGELHVRALVADGAGIREVVGNRGQAGRVGGEAKHAGVHRGADTHDLRVLLGLEPAPHQSATLPISR